MNKTYMWQRQNKIPWKGISTNSAVSSWSRPFINGPSNNSPSGPAFKARPIKHWRKQLHPRTGSGSSSHGVGMPMDRPGGSTYLGNNPERCKCQKNGGNHVLKENINKVHPIKYSSPNKKIVLENGKVICNNCNPEKNIIKSASTIINKKYYTDSRSYLKSRNKTYQQNLSGTKTKGVQYVNEEGSIMWPTDDKNGPQIRDIPTTNAKCNTASSKQTIYKPNNIQYGVQGAVSSSSRLERLKLNVVTKNGSSFKTAFGMEGANAGKYRASSDAPYFLKSKLNKCVPHKRKGNRTHCFHNTNGTIKNGSNDVQQNNDLQSTSAITPPSVESNSNQSIRKILFLVGGGESVGNFSQQTSLDNIIATLNRNEEGPYTCVASIIDATVNNPNHIGNKVWLIDGKENTPISVSNTALESVSNIDSFIDEQGPFYSIGGYSQGAAMSVIYLAMGKHKNDFKVTFLSNGYLPKYNIDLKNKLDLFAPINIPLINFYSDTDSVISRELSKEIETLFIDTKTLSISSYYAGRALPTSTNIVEQIVQYLINPDT